MQIVSNGDNLHEMSNPVFWGKKKEKYFSVLSAENFIQSWYWAHYMTHGALILVGPHKKCPTRHPSALKS